MEKRLLIGFITGVGIIAVVIAGLWLINSTSTSVDQYMRDSSADGVVGEAAVVGIWRNIVDKNYTREFKAADPGIANATVIDRSGNAVTAEGAWRIFTPAADLTADGSQSYRFRADTPYLEILEGDNARYYRIVSVTATDLELASLDDDTSFRFKRE